MNLSNHFRSNPISINSKIQKFSTHATQNTSILDNKSTSQLNDNSVTEIKNYKKSNSRKFIIHHKKGSGFYSMNDNRLDDLSLGTRFSDCLLYTSPSPRDLSTSRMPSSA